MKKTLTAATLAVLALAVSALPAAAQPGPGTTYRVTVTNISNQEILSPPIVVVHAIGTGLFESGQAASSVLAAVAEDADAAGLLANLEADPLVLAFGIADAPLPPGQSVTYDLPSRPPFGRLSVVAMLVTTNDAFAGLDGYPLTPRPWLQETTLPAYDAGSEANNELCAFIPGPPCGNAGVRDTAGAEGYIHVHPGIRGVGDLDPDVWDWHNPVAKVTIVRTGP